jgi:thiol-disulfide isomerase/thioredoxin
MHDRKFTRRTFLATAGVIAGPFPAGPVWAQNHQYGIVGQLAPELSVGYWIDKEGEPSNFSIQGAKNKWVMLKCFQDWCPGCHSSGFPALKKFADAFWDHPDVAIAGIQTVFEGFSTNTRDDVRKLQLQYQLPIVMGHDPGNPDGDHRPSTMKSFRTGGTPWIIVIAPDGRVVFNDFHVNVDRLIEYVGEQVG